jgi:hypothetical protein
VTVELDRSLSKRPRAVPLRFHSKEIVSSRDTFIRAAP